MPSRESRLPQDWFQKAKADLETVELLLAHGGDIQIAASHIQQALEKYLKGYLISKGWRLKRLHDLAALLDDAVAYDPGLERFRPACEEITAYHIQVRYPFFTEGPSREDVEASLVQAKDLVKKIVSGVK